MIAILFWCYKDPAVCADRVRLLRHHNPSTPVYVLYGGAQDGAQAMQEALAEHIDDFWAFDLNRSPRWKWKQGDRLVARWYKMRGHSLPGWNRLFVAQWDMMVTVPVTQLLEGMPDRAAVFSGRLEWREFKDWWQWVQGPLRRAKLGLFRCRLRLVEGYAGPLYSAPFIVVCAPRAYFERLSETPLGRLGFIEYRCPTFAVAWGFPYWSSPQLDAWRPGNPNTRDIPERLKIIRAGKYTIDPDLMRAELQNPEGFRVFHPVHALDADSGLGDLPYRTL